MDLVVAASAFGLIFVAEMGDKSQLVTMSLAHRHGVRPVAVGVLAAFLVLDALAILVGAALFELVPQRAVLSAAGLLFLLFAWRTWTGAGGGEEAPARTGSTRGAVAGSFLLIFVAELGDKTQLALVALAAGSGDALAVFVGGTLALWCVSLLAIVFGAVLLQRFPRAWVHRVAALLFVAFGLLALVRAWL